MKWLKITVALLFLSVGLVYAEEAKEAPATEAEYQEVYQKFVKEKEAWGIERQQIKLQTMNLQLQRDTLEQQNIQMRYSILLESIKKQKAAIRNLNIEMRKAAEARAEVKTGLPK